MVSIGRKPHRKTGIPNNKGMSTRANKHLELYASRKSDHFENSLPIDAPLMFFWYKTPGSVPCSCSSNDVGLNKDFTLDEETGASNSIVLPKSKPKWKVTGFGETEKPKKQSSVSRDATLQEQLEMDNLSDIDDDEDFLEIDDLSQSNQVNPNDTLNLFNEELISCPICFGSGYIDAWTINGGKRFVFDTSNLYGFNCVGCNIDNNEHPALLTSVNTTSYVQWRFRLPLIWNDFLRIQVYKDVTPLEPHLYNWTWYDSDTQESGEVTPESLNTLQNAGSNLLFKLEFLEDGIEWTHAEIVIAFREAYRAQIPEVQQGYQYEALDWDINISVEIPPYLNIEEGSYLTESKYGKVWKVSAINRRMTAGGHIFGLTADLRGLHPMEKKMSQLSLFRTAYNTF